MPTNEDKSSAPAAERPKNFIKDAIDIDLEQGKVQRVATRFPPEPNGYLHIGHAKSICLNFSLARDYDGTCNLRFDDTNPTAEELEYVESIKSDVHWLGFDWQDRLFFASDYFEQLYQWAVTLVKKGKAYVDSQTTEQIRENRGNYHRPGVESPYRERSVEENLDLLERMRKGEFADGTCVLRAKIDMQHPNMNMRDPLLYRIRHAHHHRTGDDWCIYPMYDFAHGQSDAIEGITHSICTLEFEGHRVLYDWFLEALELDPRPRQIEFARLNLSHTVMSKRKLLQLVKEQRVTGWDDPRMPTIAGLRRRGYTPESIRAFCDRIGVAKKDSLVDVTLLEHAIRDDLEQRAPRAMAVLRPLKLVIDNFDEGQVEQLQCPIFPDRPELGTRTVPLTRELYVERDDFREEAPKKWFRLAPGKEVRLRYACYVTCREVIKDDAGEVVELRCTWDPDSLGGSTPDGRRVRGTIHWVSASHSLPARVRLYDRLFDCENPLNLPEGQTFLDHINPSSLELLQDCRLEPSMTQVEPGARYQFERLGYFCADADGTVECPLFNRTVALRDSWAKLEQKLAASPKPPR